MKVKGKYKLEDLKKSLIKKIKECDEHEELLLLLHYVIDKDVIGKEKISVFSIMTSKKLSKYQEYIRLIMGSPIRIKIIQIIKKKPMTISNLHRKIKKPNGSLYNYKAIHKQVKLLEKHKFVYVKLQKNKQGNPMEVHCNIMENDVNEN